MNYNRNNHDEWPTDRYHNYNRNNHYRDNQNNWNQDSRHQEEDRQRYNNNYHNDNRRQQDFYGQQNHRMMNSNTESHQGWPQNYPARHDDNRYGRYNNQEGLNRDFDGRYGMPGNYNHNYQHRNGPEYDRGESHYGYTPENEYNRNNDFAVGTGAVGGSFTNYSASRSRRGHIGHNRSGGMLHREGPGMNSYRRGDINANSNW